MAMKIGRKEKNKEEDMRRKYRIDYMDMKDVMEVMCMSAH